MSKSKNSFNLLALFCLAALFLLISCFQVNSDGQGEGPETADKPKTGQPAPASPQETGSVIPQKEKPPVVRPQPVPAPAPAPPQETASVIPQKEKPVVVRPEPVPAPAPATTPLPPIELIGCREHEIALDSKARGKMTHYYAFVPESKDGQGGFPVLYLLHGAYDGYDAWKKHAQRELCDLSQKYGLIIITPDGDPFGWYADSKNLKANQIETYFFQELMPDVEKKFPCNGKQGIAGLSMGGHGAIVLALRGGRDFTSISSMSGILDITKHPTNWKMPEVFGEYQKNKENWEDHSAYYLARKNQELLARSKLLVTVSMSDKLAYEDNQSFHQLLDQLGIKHSYQFSPGNHDWDYWLAQLPVHVQFHARYLNNENKATTAAP